MHHVRIGEFDAVGDGSRFTTDHTADTDRNGEGSLLSSSVLSVVDRLLRLTSVISANLALSN